MKDRKLCKNGFERSNQKKNQKKPRFDQQIILRNLSHFGKPDLVDLIYDCLIKSYFLCMLLILLSFSTCSYFLINNKL